MSKAVTVFFNTTYNLVTIYLSRIAHLRNRLCIIITKVIMEIIAQRESVNLSFRRECLCHLKIGRNLQVISRLLLYVVRCLVVCSVHVNTWRSSGELCEHLSLACSMDRKTTRKRYDSQRTPWETSLECRFRTMKFPLFGLINWPTESRPLF